MKPGFSILEFVIGAMISTILITAAFTVYDSISRSSRKIQLISTEDTKIMLFYHRLQKDLTSLCPLWFTKEPYEKAKSTSSSSEKESSKPKPPTQPSEQKDPNIHENGFFYAQTNKNNELEYFTFVTTEGMHVFDEPSNPLVRIVYRLIKDPQYQQNLLLQRKEIHTISSDFKEQEIINEGKFYTLIDTILSCKIDFIFIDTPKEKKDEQADKEITLKNLKNWGANKETSENSDTHEQQPVFPQFIKFRIKFANTQEKEPAEHEIVFQIFASPQSKLTPLIEQKNNNAKPPINPNNQPPTPSPRINPNNQRGYHA